VTKIKKFNNIFILILLIVLLSIPIFAARRPIYNSDLNTWGYIWSNYTDVSFDVNGTLRGNESIIRVTNSTWLKTTLDNATINRSISLDSYNQSISLNNYLKIGDASSFVNGSDINVTLFNVYKLNGTELSLFNKSISLDY